MKKKNSEFSAKLTRNTPRPGFNHYGLCVGACVLFLISFLCSFCVADDGEEIPSPAAWKKWVGLSVVSVKFECDGDFPQDKVRNATLVKADSVYSRTEVRKSIEEIYSLGDFSNVTARVQPVIGGVELTFILTKQIKTRNVTFDGNKVLNNDEIVRVIKLKADQGYDSSIVQSDRESIEMLYRSHGFFNVDIVPLTNMDQTNKMADVTFKISEGEQPIVEKVILIGTIENRPKDEAAIRASNLEDKMKKVRRGKPYKGQRDLDSDVKHIEELYREAGYITAKVKEARALLDPNIIAEYNDKGKHFPAGDIEKSDLKNGKVTIVIEIVQGKKVYIEIEGNDNINDYQIGKAISIQRMHSVSGSVLSKSDEDIRKLYRSNGYYLVEVSHEVLKDKVWNFDKDGDANGWKLLDESAPLDVSGGALRMSTSSGIRQIQSPEVRMGANVYEKLLIRMKTDKGSVGRLYWLIDGDKNKWKEKRHKDFDLISDGKFHNYEIIVSNNKHWSKNVAGLRLEPVDVSGADIEIASIKVITESIPIVFRVTENQPMRIGEISIKPAYGETLQIKPEEIRKQMLTRRKPFLASFWPFKRYLPKGVFDETVFQADMRAILAFYRSEGYPNAKIVSHKPDPQPEKRKINIELTISEGPKIVITDVILEGNDRDVLSNREIFSDLKLVPNFDERNLKIESLNPQIVRYKIDPPIAFLEDNIVDDRSTLRSKYADEGYFAQIEAFRETKEDKTQVMVTYRINEGNLIRIDKDIKINIRRPENRDGARTKRRIIERELSKRLMEERIFSRVEIARSWQRLLDLGLFDGVRIDTRAMPGSEELYEMIVDVTEKKAISVNTHVGFSSSSSSTVDFRGGIEATHINLWGTGRRIGGKAQIGTEGRNYGLNYAEPRFLGTRALGEVEVYRYSKDDLAEARKGFTAKISQKIHRLNTLTYQYKYDFVEYEDEDVISGGKIARSAKIGSVGTTFYREGRDNPLNPTKGWLHALTLEYANTWLGGTENFAKLTLNDIYYTEFFGKVVLAMGARSGYAWDLGGTESVLTPEQFNLSDYTTPRGYKWKIEDIRRAMLNVSAELRFPIYKWVGAAAFFDSGYVFDRPSEFDFRDMKSSVGLGLRLMTPIGPFRLDYGYPVQGDGNREYWPQIAFGHSF